MAIAAIHNWLHGNCPYKEGLALLKQYGAPSETTIFLLDRTENPHGRRVLTKALQDVYANGLTIAQEEAKAITSRQVISTVEEVAYARADGDDPKKDIPEESLPASLRPLRRRLSQLHTTKTFLRGGLRNTPDGWPLRKLSLEIIELHKEMKAGWFIIETYRATGTILSADTPKQLQNDGELRRELTNLRTNITKYEKGQRKPNEEKLKAMHARRDEIMKLLEGAIEPA